MLTKMFKVLVTLILLAAATFAFCKACTYETKAVEPVAEKPIVYEQMPEAPISEWENEPAPIIVPTVSIEPVLEVVAEEEEEPSIDWSTIIDVKKYARAPYNLDVVSEGYVRPPLNDEVYKVVNGIPVTNRELHMLGLTIWGEANGQSMMEQAAVAWSILNRVDNADGENFARGHSLTYVLQFPGKAPGQIHGYWNTKGAKCADYWLMIAIDVVDRWALEWEGAEAEDVGRVLPKEYTYWCGVNGHNRFRTAHKTNEPRWDWSLPNPYEEITE